MESLQRMSANLSEIESSSESFHGTKKDSGLNKDGIKTGAVVAHMLTIAMGFLQFGKCSRDASFFFLNHSLTECACRVWVD